MIRKKLTNKDLKKEDFELYDDEKELYLKNELVFGLALDIHAIIFLITIFIFPFIIYEYDGSISNINLFDYFKLRTMNGGVNIGNSASNIVFLIGIWACGLCLLFGFIFVFTNSFRKFLNLCAFKNYKEIIYKKGCKLSFSLFHDNPSDPIGVVAVYLIIIAILVTNVDGIKNAFQIRGFNFTILFSYISLLPTLIYYPIYNGSRRILRFDFKNYREREPFYDLEGNEDNNEKPVIDIKNNNLDKKEVVKEKPSTKKDVKQNKETKKTYKKVRETDKKEVNKPKEQVVQKNNIQTKKKTVKDKQASKTAIKKAKTKNKDSKKPTKKTTKK